MGAKRRDEGLQQSAVTYPIAVVAELKKHYQALSAEESEEGKPVALHPEALTDEDRENLKIDLDFYAMNPNLPLEDLCATLSNYEPQTASQERMLALARAFIAAPTGATAGMFVYGEPGIGKTHICVGVAKELMRQGRRVIYLQTKGAGMSRRMDDTVIDSLTGDTVIIIDDLNSPYGDSMRAFKAICRHYHNVGGGKILASSNTSYEALMANAFVTDPDEQARYMDRMRNMFYVLHAEGQSHRRRASWVPDGLRDEAAPDTQEETDTAPPPATLDGAGTPRHRRLSFRRGQRK